MQPSTSAVAAVPPQYTEPPPSAAGASHQPATADEIRTLWIGDLQYWMDERYLVSCFAQSGEVISAKVIRNKQTGQSESYGFIEFVSRAAAERHLQTYNGTLMPNVKQNFRLNWASFGVGEKRADGAPDFTIFVGDWAADVTDYTLEETFRAHYPSVKSAKVVIVRMTGLTKGNGFVKFGNETEHLRAMTEMNGRLCPTRPMCIGPADNKNTAGGQQYPKASYQNTQGTQNEEDPTNTTVFVGGLDPNVSDGHLKQVFSQYGQLVHVEIAVGKRFGLVQFADRSCAEEAMRMLQGTQFGGQTVRLSWGHSPNKQMDPSNDTSKRDDQFNWTDITSIILCAFLNDYLEKNGRTSPFKWTEIQSQFEKIVKHKFQSNKAVKKKYQKMRQDYYIWTSLMRSLKHHETVPGWNGRSEKVIGSSDWWEMKIKENPSLKRFSKEQPSIKLQEAWNHLFGKVVASGVNCVAPSIEPSAINEVPCMNLKEDDITTDHDENTHGVHNNHASLLENLEKQQDSVTNPNHIGGSKQPHKSTKVNDKSKHTMMKRRVRELSGVSKFKDYMIKQDTTEEKILEMIMSDISNVNQAPSVDDQAPCVNQASSFSVNAAISVINGMVNQGLMAKDELWCFAMCLFEDAVKREIFMSLPDDAGRMKWLQYKHKHGI